MNADEKIRAILRMEADAVEPSAAGFDAIREGVAKRRARTWWVRGSAFAGVGLTTAAAMVVLTSNPSPQTIQQPPAASSSATAEPTPGTTPVATPPVPAGTTPGTPLGTIWPLTTQGELASWNADRTTYPALASAATSAQAFVNNYLLMPQAKAVAAGEKDGDLFFDVTYLDNVVTKLEVRGFGSGGTAPFLVTRATSEALKIASPLPESKVTSPIRPNGDVHEVEPQITVRLRADGPGSAPEELGDEKATNNAPNVWNAELAFDTPRTTGSLWVYVLSPRGDGLLTAAAVVPVTFAPTPAGTPVGDGFAAVTDQRIAYYTPEGKLVRYLTGQQPGGGMYTPDVSPDGTRVAWSQGAGTCVMVAQYMSLTGGEPVTIGDGTGMSSRPTWVGNTRIAYAHTTCEGVTELRLYDVTSKKATTLTRLAGEPTALGAGSDARHLAYVVGTTLRTYEIGSGATETVPLYSGCRWRAVDVIGTSTVGRPILLTASTCEREPGLLVDRFATNAPERERVTERKHDGVVYRVSWDAPSKSFLVSHGLEDGQPYTEVQTLKDLYVVRGADHASW